MVCSWGAVSVLLRKQCDLCCEVVHTVRKLFFMTSTNLLHWYLSPQSPVLARLESTPQKSPLLLHMFSIYLFIPKEDKLSSQTLLISHVSTLLFPAEHRIHLPEWSFQQKRQKWGQEPIQASLCSFPFKVRARQAKRQLRLVAECQPTSYGHFFSLSPTTDHHENKILL